MQLQEEAGSADEDARVRDGMYERAERLASALAHMGEQLRSAIDNVNSTALAQVLPSLNIFQEHALLVQRASATEHSGMGCPLQLCMLHLRCA